MRMWALLERVAERLRGPDPDVRARRERLAVGAGLFAERVFVKDADPEGRERS
jgi:hypothetical protein